MQNRDHLVASFVAGTLFAAAVLSPDAGAQSAWSRTYGGPVSEQGLKDLALLPGGQLVVAGYTASFGGPTQASWLMNLDPGTGAITTQQVSTSTFGGFTDGARVASDGGALFLGRDVHDIFDKHDAWMMRANASGDVLWRLGFTREGVGRHFLFDAAELGDGSWIAVGATGLQSFPPQAAWVVRVSSAGELLWQYEYGGGVVETASSVTLTQDGGFAVAGWTNSSGAGGDDVWVMKLDSTGTILWQKTFGSTGDEQCQEIVELSDGSFAVAGYTNGLTPSGHAPWILKLESNGDLDWHKVVASSVWGEVEGVAETVDGELIVVGRVAEVGFPSNDLWSARLAVSDGSVQWQRAYEGATGDYGSAVLPLDCDGYVLGGTWGWGFAGESIWLQRVGGGGELASCKIVRATTFATIEPKIEEGAGATVQAEAGALTMDPGVQLAGSDAVVTELCTPGTSVLEVSRVGVPPNPEALLPGVTTGPVIGGTWDPVIDHTTFMPGAILDILALGTAPTNFVAAPYGTVLCLGTVFTYLAFPSTPFEVAIPADCSIVGVGLCTQGASWDGTSPPTTPGAVLLTNALDITLGTF